MLSCDLLLLVTLAHLGYFIHFQQTGIFKIMSIPSQGFEQSDGIMVGKGESGIAPF